MEGLSIGRQSQRVTMNCIGVWRKRHAQHLWVMSNLTPERTLQIYSVHMKIEQALKSLLGLDELMNNLQAHMQQTLALPAGQMYWPWS